MAWKLKNQWTKEGQDENVLPEILGFLSEVDPITTWKLETALQRTKKGKVQEQTINIELIKYSTVEVQSSFLNFLNNCLQKRCIPEIWKEAEILPIFKRGERTKCENYRGIRLLNDIYKIYAKILTSKLQIIAEAIILEEQSGFRRGNVLYR